MLFYKLSILIAVFFFHSEIGQTQPKQKTAEGVIISGQIEGSKYDSVEVYFFPDANIIMEKQVFVTKTDDKGLFHFSFPDHLKKGSRLTLRSGKLGIAGSSEAYLVENGDDIFVSVKKTGNDIADVHYSGKGSAKYECRRKIDFALEKLDFVEIDNRQPGFYTGENVKQICERIDSFMPLQILEAYKNRMTAVAYQLMKADILGKVRRLCLIEILRLYADGINDTEKAKAAELQDKFMKAVDNAIPADIKMLSVSYQTLLFTKITNELLFEMGPTYSMNDVYFKIRMDYKGILREHLLIYTLVHGNRWYKGISGDAVDSLWKDAYTFLTEPSLKHYVKKNVVKIKGTDALDFSINNSKGGIVNLHDLKGKVVVIDIWYTGCPGCRSYSENLERDVYKVFKDDPDVVFVSMNGDNSKERWLKSVREGKYTREENINLNTNGMGFDHPWMKYYGFNGGPYSLIIDKNGKIFSGNPPTNDMDSLISLIKNATSQNK